MMGLTREMMILCKRIHAEIIYSLVFVNVKDEAILEFMTQTDEIINECLDLLRQKQLISIEERKELSEIAQDIKKLYEAIDKNTLDSQVAKILEHIMNCEHKAIEDEIKEHEINGTIEEKLGELHDSLNALLDRAQAFKYERTRDSDMPTQTLFDALFKIEATNDLLKQVKIMQKQFAQECLIMSAIEDLYKKVGRGELQLHDLLEEVGVDPEHNKASLAKLPLETLKKILKQAEALAEELEREEEKS